MPRCRSIDDRFVAEATSVAPSRRRRRLPSTPTEPNARHGPIELQEPTALAEIAVVIAASDPDRAERIGPIRRYARSVTASKPPAMARELGHSGLPADLQPSRGGGRARWISGRERPDGVRACATFPQSWGRPASSVAEDVSHLSGGTGESVQVSADLGHLPKLLKLRHGVSQRDGLAIRLSQKVLVAVK